MVMVFNTTFNNISDFSYIMTVSFTGGGNRNTRRKSNYHTNTTMTAQSGTNGTNKVYKISYKSTHWFIIIRTFSDRFLILVH